MLGSLVLSISLFFFIFFFFNDTATTEIYTLSLHDALPISAAYDVLGDAEKRKSYDQVREMASSGARGGFPGGGFPGNVRVEGFNVEDLGDIGDLFGGLFGGRRGRSRQQASSRGDDLETEVRI